MRPNGTDFRFDGRRERAARMVAEDDMPDHRIAAEIGIGKATLERWKQHPVFAARVTEYVKALEAETLRFAIAKRRKRVGALDDRWKRMQQVIDERAAILGAPEDDVSGDDAALSQRKPVPGGKTGLLTRQLKGVGHGDDFTLVTEYAVDIGLLKELRAHEEQAAKELGQWIDKSEMVIDDVGLSDADRVARIDAILERARQNRARQASANRNRDVDSASGSTDDGV